MKERHSPQPPLSRAKDVVKVLLRARLNNGAGNALSSMSKSLRRPLGFPCIRDLRPRGCVAVLKSRWRYVKSVTSRALRRAASKTSARDCALSKKRADACTSPFPIVLSAASQFLSKLEFTNLRGPLHPSFFIALAQCSSVTTLRLTAAWLYNFQQLRRLIAALRSLKHLDICDVNSQQVPDETHAAPNQLAVFTPTPIRLQTLMLNVSSSVQSIYLAALIDWLVRASICESLTSLTLYGPPRLRKELAEKTSLLFLASGPSLLTLKNPYFSVLDYKLTPKLPFHIVNCDLSRNINLVHLSLRLHAMHWSTLVDELSSILSSIRSAKLKDIKMLYNWQPTALQSFPFVIELDALHALLNVVTYDNLTNVEINVSVVDAFLDRYANRHRREAEVETGFRTLFTPWSERLAGSFVFRKLW